MYPNNYRIVKGAVLKEECSIPVVNTGIIYTGNPGEAEIFSVVPEQRKPSVLLHACCGPCSTSCVERLAPDYNVTVYYYNPNTERYIAKCGPLADEPEGGARCDVCFAMRLAQTARKAGEIGADYFTTTMSVSPHKNYDKIRTLGLSLEEESSARFLDVDFKKKNGFGRSVEMSRKYGLYRQNFCGCEYARAAMKK